MSLSRLARFPVLKLPFLCIESVVKTWDIFDIIFFALISKRTRSRSVRFPLLKLPFLCIESVIKSWDIIDIIYFALISKRTRRIVKHLKIPLKTIQIILSIRNYIMLGNLRKNWFFENERQYLGEYPLVLQKDAIPLYTRKYDSFLKSYADGNEITALRMAMEFLNEVFKCTVGCIFIDKCDLLDSFGPLSQAENQQLNLLLENLEVTGTCYLQVANTENGFYCNPKLFKCKKLEFSSYSARWVTREILMQFEVPQLFFKECQFSEEDLVAFVNQWFHSDNQKFEYLHIQCNEFLHAFCRQVSLKTFQKEDLNSLPFNERTRVPPTESFRDIDFSKGLEIRRNDGLEATIHVNRGNFLFYIWHER